MLSGHNYIDLCDDSTELHQMHNQPRGPIDVPLLLIDEAGAIFNNVQELGVLRKRLILINHVKGCSNAVCQIEDCAKLQFVIKLHFRNCTIGSLCKVPFCMTTRKLYEHQNYCANTHCVLCSFVTKNLAYLQPQEHQQQNQTNPLNLMIRIKEHSSANSIPVIVSSAQTLEQQNIYNQSNDQRMRIENWLGLPVGSIQSHNMHPYQGLSNPPQTNVYTNLIRPNPVRATATVISNQMPSSSTPNGVTTNQQGIKYCAKCRNHGLKIDIREHKRYCSYSDCKCSRCEHHNKLSRRNTVKRFPMPMLMDQTPKMVKVEDTNDTVNENGIIWKKFDPKINEGALVYAGRDSNNCAVYVGRTYLGEHLLPAKFSLKNGVFSTTINNSENKLMNGEMLIDGGYLWKKADDGVIPKNAVFGGLLSDGQNLFIGKSTYEGKLVVGRVTVDGALYAAFNGREIMKNNFDVLVKDDGTKSSDSIAPVRQCAVCWDEAPIVGIFIECCHACLCNNCIAPMNAKRNKNGKVNCVLCTRECHVVRRIHFN